MNEVRLTGLEGTNPLGFLAALGVQVSFASEPEQPRLWWSDDITPRAIVDGGFTVERIAARAREVFAQWKGSPALNPTRPDGAPMPKGDELKLTGDDLRAYIGQTRLCKPGSTLITALVAEGSLDNQDAAKPSDFYFTAGQQKFLSMARQVLSEASREDVIVGLEGPWTYDSSLPSLMWDVRDDRAYALAAGDPAKDKKETNPGPEALSILGLSLYPVFGSRERTLTQGCSGAWKAGWYSWPLWRKPASLNAVKALLAHAYALDQQPVAEERRRWLRSWGIDRIYRSSIRRSEQGGYGTFGPPEVAWQASIATGMPI